MPASNKLITLHIINEIITHDSAATGLSKSDRALIAVDLIRNIASPVGNIEQIGKTCILAAYEVRLATLYPELYASLIMQVVLNGKFQCTDSSFIVFPLNSLSNKETAGNANWANRIFQIEIANIAWQKAYTRPDHLSAPLGSLRYEMVGAKEFLRDYSLDQKTGLPVYSNDGGKISSPTIDRDQRFLINKMITGEEVVFQVSSKWAWLKAPPGTYEYSSYAELQRFLEFTSQGKLPGVRFPLVITVDGEMLEDGLSSPRLGEKAKPTHLATIMAYDTQNQKIWLNNTWGYKEDWVGDRALTMQQFWQFLPAPRGMDELHSRHY